MSPKLLESNTPLKNPPVDYAPSDSVNYFVISEGFDTDKRMFYFDYQVGQGEPDACILFVHGNPESSYTFRHIRDALIASGENIRLVAMDHIGFGLSDQATYEMIDMHHSSNLWQLVTHLDLRDVTLVVHDWGGPIGIGAFCDEPTRVSALMVMNTTIFPMPKDGYTYENFPLSWFPWSYTPKLIPNALWGGLAGYVVSNSLPQGTLSFLFNASKYMFLYGTHSISSKSPEYVWSESFRSTPNTKSSKRNVMQTPYWGHGYQYHDPTHGEQDNSLYYQTMQQQVPISWGPEGQNIKVSGFFGQWDACGKDSVIQQWQTALPQMIDHTYIFPDIGHFIEEYKGEEMAASILEMNGLGS